MSAQAFYDPSALAEDRSFKPAARGKRARGGIDVRREQGWTVLVHHKPFVGDPLADSLGQPGLWRALPDTPTGAGPSVRGDGAYVFEIPPGVAHSEGEGGSPGEPPTVELLDWARATSGGMQPPAADGPAREEVESWIDPVRRHVRAGGHVTAVEIRADGTRLGLSTPSLVQVPADLSPVRSAWLRELCLDAQTRWRLVRFGVVSGSVRAEVDLTGAPPECARALCEIALAALTTAAAWLLPALAGVADPRVGSRLLDQPPSRDASRPHQGGTA
jgi:hypothetical protein